MSGFEWRATCFGSLRTKLQACTKNSPNMECVVCKTLTELKDNSNVMTTFVKDSFFKNVSYRHTRELYVICGTSAEVVESWGVHRMESNCMMWWWSAQALPKQVVPNRLLGVCSHVEVRGIKWEMFVRYINVRYDLVYSKLYMEAFTSFWFFIRTLWMFRTFHFVSFCLLSLNFVKNLQQYIGYIFCGLVVFMKWLPAALSTLWIENN